MEVRQLAFRLDVQPDDGQFPRWSMSVGPRRSRFQPLVSAVGWERMVCSRQWFSSMRVSDRQARSCQRPWALTSASRT